ncbi:hypothetical protein ATKI12_6969 [Kitasatospora sp. Ki12]
MRLHAGQENPCGKQRARAGSDQLRHLSQRVHSYYNGVVQPNRAT